MAKKNNDIAVIEDSSVPTVSAQDGASVISKAITEGFQFIRVLKLEVGEAIRGLYRGMYGEDFQDPQTGEIRALKFAHLEVGSNVIVKMCATYQIEHDLARAREGDMVVIMREGEERTRKGFIVHTYLVGIKSVSAPAAPQSATA